jgi:hypothetical protein
MASNRVVSLTSRFVQGAYPRVSDAYYPVPGLVSLPVITHGLLQRMIDKNISRTIIQRVRSNVVHTSACSKPKDE